MVLSILIVHLTPMWKIINLKAAKKAPIPNNILN